jgi:hypothetical protein
MRLGIRWTIGDVSTRGFETLALSIAGANKVFGDDAEYVVCVNTISVEAARQRVGRAADLVDWLDCSALRPAWLRNHVGAGMAGGVAWKFSPPRLFPDRHVLSLDNDVILWRMPDSVRLWLQDGNTLLIAEDVACCYGAFVKQCPVEPRNSGIVGFPPGWEVETKLRELLHGVRLMAEGDEQGLQTAMITSVPHRVVSLSEVSISGYFRPHLLQLGTCGAHFVGVNVKHSAATWLGRSSEQFMHEFWDWKKAEVARRVTEGQIADAIIEQNGFNLAV